MYTLDIKKRIIAYIGLAIFLYIFNMVYEHFSFGEYSWFMRNMYLIPEIGAGIMLIFWLGLRCKPDRGFVLLFNSAMAIFISGCIVRGIIEISGRSSDYDIYYIVAGSLFLAGAIFRQSFVTINKKDD